MIEFGEFAPDQPDLDVGGHFTTVAKNVIPRTKTATGRSYGPLGSQSALTNALDGACKGAAAFRDSGGNVYSFAGDGSKLYLLDQAIYSSVGSGFTTADDDYWGFTKFGERIIACNGHTDDLQSYVMGTSSSFSQLSAAAPRARHVAQIRDHVFALNTFDSTDGVVPNRVWWPAINNPTDWPTIGSADAASKQSDRQDLPSGGWGQAITGAVGGVDGVIFMDNAVYRVVYEGSPTIYGFYEVERARGTVASNSVVNVGDFCFYLGQDGFYAFTGQDSQPIGDQRIDRTFFSRFGQDYPHLVWGAADAIGKQVMWVYPSTLQTAIADKAVIYNWATNEWSEAEFNCQCLFRDLTQGYTLEGLDAIGTMETLPYSLDSRVWTGGKDILATFDTDNKNATFSGSNLAATIESQEIGGEQRILVDGIRPYVDVSDTSNLSVSLRYRDDAGGNVTTSSSSSIDSDGQAHFTGVSARYVRGQVSIAAGASWTHAQGIDADFQTDGAT